MNKAVKRKWFNSKTFAVGFVILILLAINLLTFKLPQLDQFNVLYRYDRIYSLLDWNIPHNVHEIIDSDSKVDVVTYYGCVFLSTRQSSNIPNDRLCYDNVVEEGKMKGYQIPISQRKIINSYLGKKGSSWNIVVHTLGETKLYEIATEGLILEKQTPLTLKVDSILYLLSHLYVFLYNL